jgi:hypothetical protein
LKWFVESGSLAGAKRAGRAGESRVIIATNDSREIDIRR